MLTSLRAILRAAARSLGVERAAYAALIEELWPEIIGSDAAAHTRPVGLRGTTLLVDADAEAGLWAQELSAQRAKFVTEINRRLGAKAVTEIRFRQTTAPGVFPAFVKGKPVTPDEPALTPDEEAAIERAVGEIGDPEMREAARRAMTSQVRWRKRHAGDAGNQ